MRKEKDEQLQEEQEMSKEEKEILELKEKLELSETELSNWKNKYYSVYADMDNLRKQLERDHADAIRYRAEGFIENLLPALDAFHIALGSEPNGEEAKNYQKGFQYIYNQLISVLAEEGVVEIIPNVGDHFDSTFMHAIETVESDGPEGLVVKVLSKGYKLKDRLIRPVIVSVSTSKKEDKKENEEANKA